MKTIGQQFKEAREARGESLSDAAKATRIKVQQLAGLENDDFSAVPALTYAKGFIRLYGRHLGLDAESLVEQYLTQQSEAAAPSPPKMQTPVLEESAPVEPTPPAPPATQVLPPVDELPVPVDMDKASEEQEPAPKRRPLVPAGQAELSEPRLTLQGSLWIKAGGALVAVLLVAMMIRSCADTGPEPVESPDEFEVPAGEPLTDEPVLIEPPSEPWIILTGDDA